LSARIANALVGNPVGNPLIEVVATDFAFRAEDFLLMAVSGASAEIEVDGCPHESGQPVCVEPGSLVRVSGINAGLRCYLAIRGSFRAPRLLGSCAPDPMLGAGGSLTAGARLDIDSTYQSFKHPYLPQPLFRFGTIDRTVGAAVTIDVIRGPHADQFHDGADVLASNQYIVCADSNHVGLRLQGPAPARNRRDELLSRGVPLGAVEIPPSEELIVLLRGRMVTAGYPVIAVATRTSRDTLGQLGPAAS
jgi:allophanate hydrolase subunit 2